MNPSPVSLPSFDEVASSSHALWGTAKRHGAWSGENTDLARALEQAAKELPKKPIGGTYAELAEDIHFINNRMLVNSTMNSLRLAEQVKAPNRAAISEDLSKPE